MEGKTQAPNDDQPMHPLYDVSMHIDALYSIPLYRNPEHPLIVRWRELGEQLLAQKEADLAAAIEQGRAMLRTRVGPRRRRRRAPPDDGGPRAAPAVAKSPAFTPRRAIYIAPAMSEASPAYFEPPPPPPPLDPPPIAIRRPR